MSVSRLVEVHLGDVARLRKPHPCGGYDWTIVRLGADLGLRCLTCGHRVLLPRSQFERRLKLFVHRAVPPESHGAGAVDGESASD